MKRFFFVFLLAGGCRPPAPPAREFGLLPRGGKAALETPSVLGPRAVGLIREQGVIVRGIRDLIAMSPPLIVTREEVDQLFAAVGSMLERLWD